MGGNGVAIYSNGPLAPSGPSPDTYNYINNINGASTQTGIEWQCVELVNRLYITKGWITSTWTGNGSDLYGNAPSNLTKQPQGSITSINPGDVLGMSKNGTPGHAAIVSSVSGSSITIASQNTNVVYDTSFSLSSGYITFSGWSGYTIQGVIHHPNNLGQKGPVTYKDDFGIWRLMNTYDGTWYVAKNENGIANGLVVNGWVHGSPGDIPLSADFNKDGIADMVIYRLVNGVGTWYVEDGASPHGHLAIWGAQFGQPGDIPVVGDFNGDGYADFGVWRIVNSTGTWYIINGTNGQPTPIWGAQHGSPGDIPVVGDFNGDHIADFGIYRVINGTGTWYFKSGANGQQISWAWGVQHGGWAGDLPVVGDFDGDGYSDFGIYRPINGTGYWYVRSGVNVGNMIINGAVQGGWNGDIPLSGNFG